MLLVVFVEKTFVLSDERKEESDLLSLLNDSDETLEYGPSLLEQLSTGMVKSVTGTLSKEIMDPSKRKVLVPWNCKTTGVPKVNPELWNSVPNKARLIDLRLLQTQQSLSHGLVTFAKIAELLA